MSWVFEGCIGVCVTCRGLGRLCFPCTVPGTHTQLHLDPKDLEMGSWPCLPLLGGKT